MQAFMDQAIGGQNDAYLKKLAMTVVQLQAMSEITALQSDLLKEKAEITRETKSISDSKVQIAQAGLDLGRGVFVREQALDPRETIACGGGKAVEKGVLGVQPRQVGRKFQGRHGWQA